MSPTVMIPQYRPIYTPVHVHLVGGSILFPSSGGNSLVAKLSSGEPGICKLSNPDYGRIMYFFCIKCRYVTFCIILLASHVIHFFA